MSSIEVRRRKSEGGRCPFCHGEIQDDEPILRCLHCEARHHAECVQEHQGAGLMNSRSRCCSCGQEMGRNQKPKKPCSLCSSKIEAWQDWFLCTCGRAYCYSHRRKGDVRCKCGHTFVYVPPTNNVTNGAGSGDLSKTCSASLLAIAFVAMFSLAGNWLLAMATFALSVIAVGAYEAFGGQRASELSATPSGSEDGGKAPGPLRRSARSSRRLKITIRPRDLNDVPRNLTRDTGPAYPFGPPADPIGPPAYPFGPPADPFGPPADPFGPPADPFGPPADPFGPPADLSSRAEDPFGLPAVDPFGLPPLPEIPELPVHPELPRPPTGRLIPPPSGSSPAGAGGLASHEVQALKPSEEASEENVAGEAEAQGSAEIPHFEWPEPEQPAQPEPESTAPDDQREEELTQPDGLDLSAEEGPRPTDPPALTPGPPAPPPD